MKQLKKYSVLASTILTLSLFTSCTPRCTEPPMTQLQIREIQTMDFETDNTKLVMKSMMNVLQDEGFIIKNAVIDLGLLSAEKNINVEDKTKAILLTLCAGKEARWDKHQVLEASANISEFGCKTRVRINFQTKTLDNFGCPQTVASICDPLYYQIFFEKVSKGIFIQQQQI